MREGKPAIRYILWVFGITYLLILIGKALLT